MAGELPLVCIKPATQWGFVIIFSGNKHLAASSLLANCSRNTRALTSGRTDKAAFYSRGSRQTQKNLGILMGIPVGPCRSFPNVTAVRRLRNTHLKPPYRNLAFLETFSHWLSRLLKKVKNQPTKQKTEEKNPKTFLAIFNFALASGFYPSDLTSINLLKEIKENSEGIVCLFFFYFLKEMCVYLGACTYERDFNILE